MPRVSNAFKDYTSIKPLNKNKHNVTLLMFNQTLDHSSQCKMRTGWPYIGHFGVVWGTGASFKFKLIDKLTPP